MADMKTMELSVKNQSVETSGLTKDYKEAICEYIWNSFEANATEVKVSFIPNATQEGIESITISDNGDGINFDELEDTFGAFLVSKKNSFSLKPKTKANKGKGRFSFCLFATQAEWITRYKCENIIRQYRIVLHDLDKQNLAYTEPEEDTTATSTGTVVTLSNISNLHPCDLSHENLEEYFLTEFAWFLYLHKEKHLKLILNGAEIDYSKLINNELSKTEVYAIESYSFQINLIVWRKKISEKFCCYYLNANDILRGLDTTTFNRNTVDFNHSIFIKSAFFTETFDADSLSDDPVQVQFGQGEEYFSVLKKLKKFTQDLISSQLALYMAGKADEEIDKMIKERKTFPRFSDDAYGKLRKADLVRVTKEIYCTEPRIFYKLKEVQEKSLLAFLNLLLSSEERENILVVIEQIVNLSADQRRRLAGLLQKSKLEHIIDTIHFVESRYEVIEVLKHLVYDLSVFTTERNHIQTIVEQHYWIFGERYALASADVPMQKALEGYLNILYGAHKPQESLAPDEEQNRRMDIFLCGASRGEDSFENALEENIIVELKAPKVPLSVKVLRQIEDYMRFIRRQPQFNSIQRRWKFIAVCNEVDEDVKAYYKEHESKGKIGLVRCLENFEIYALTWDDVFKSFDLRHGFMLDKLKFNRDQLTSELSALEKSRETADELTKKITISN